MLAHMCTISYYKELQPMLSIDPGGEAEARPEAEMEKGLLHADLLKVDRILTADLPP